MPVRPLYDRVVIKRETRETEDEKTQGGLITPDTAKEKPQRGLVVAVGSGRLVKEGMIPPLEVKRGDRVLFGKFSGSDFKLDGEEHLILREDDVLAILE
jgi:chaperonin GroES